MPKTLAALPSSQYATAFELESGNRDADLSSPAAGQTTSAAETAEWCRIFPRIMPFGFWQLKDADRGDIEEEIALVDSWGCCRQLKRRRDSEGAARRRACKKGDGDGDGMVVAPFLAKEKARGRESERARERESEIARG